MKDIFEQWKHRYSDIAKLQSIYAVTIVVSVFLAGLIALLNFNASGAILELIRTVITVFVVNLLVWALAKPYVSSKGLASRSRKK